MSGKSVKKPIAEGVGQRLDLGLYHQICADLWNWRIDDFVRGLGQKEGSILAFVRGLHFSAQLIYAIRDIISEAELKVDWGHLLDKNEKYCSRECDIIIHKRGFHGQWNGRIMDFRFINQEKAIAVISCKSYLRSGGVDKNYVKCLKPFVKKVWLIAECCEPKHTKAIARQARGAGYQNFWYMYKWSRETTGREQNENGWLDFVAKLRRLKA